MSLFKKYLAEARSPTTPTTPKPRKSKRVWSVSPQKAEKYIASDLALTPQQRTSTANSDSILSSVVANSIHNRIASSTNSSIQNTPLKNVTHVGSPKQASKRRKERLGVAYYTSGRPVEDITATVGDIHHFIDLKTSSGSSSGSWSARKLNIMLGGTTRDSRRKRYKDKVARKEIVPHKAERSKSAKGKIAQDIEKYFNHDIHAEEKTRMDRIFGPKIFSKISHERVNRRVYNRKESIIQQIMNVHEKIPKNIKRHQVHVTSDGITIHDPDHAWNYFKKTFKPTHYTMKRIVSNRGEQTVHVLAHRTNNEGKEETFHLASIGVKHSRGEGDTLNYNAKHTMLDNLIKKYGYNAHTYIPRPIPR